MVVAEAEEDMDNLGTRDVVVETGMIAVKIGVDVPVADMVV